jgi:hypothetical protein
MSGKTIRKMYVMVKPGIVPSTVPIVVKRRPPVQWVPQSLSPGKAADA